MATPLAKQLADPSSNGLNVSSASQDTDSIPYAMQPDQGIHIVQQYPRAQGPDEGQQMINSDMARLNKVRMAQARPYGSEGAEPSAEFPQGLEPNHPGKMGHVLHALSVAGNIAGDIFAPATMANIPGTQLNMQEKEGALAHRLNDEIGDEATNKQKQATTENVQAETKLHGAQAEAAQLHEITPEMAENYGQPSLAGQMVPAAVLQHLETTRQNVAGREYVSDNKQTAPGRLDAFHEWMQNPDDYEKFQKAMATAKAKPAAGSSAHTSMMSFYAAIKGLQLAYSHNPGLLPVFGPVVEHLFAQMGTPMPAGAAEILSETPHDQPLSATTGKPIGTSMPGAPTGATRSQAQVAQRVLTEIPRIQQEVTDAANSLGPAKGRLLVRYLLGGVGSTGDPAADQSLSKLRSDLMFMGSGSAKFHINSVRQAAAYEKLLDAGKSPAEAIKGTIDSMKEWATSAAAQQKGFGEQGGAPPPGSKIIKWEDVK